MEPTAGGLFPSTVAAQPHVTCLQALWLQSRLPGVRPLMACCPAGQPAAAAGPLQQRVLGGSGLLHCRHGARWRPAAKRGDLMCGRGRSEASHGCCSTSASAPAACARPGSRHVLIWAGWVWVLVVPFCDCLICPAPCLHPLSPCAAAHPTTAVPPAVQVGGLEWRLKLWPRGDDAAGGDHLSGAQSVVVRVFCIVQKRGAWGSANSGHSACVNVSMSAV